MSPRASCFALALLVGAGGSSAAFAQKIDDTCAARVTAPPTPEQVAIIEGYRIDHDEIELRTGQKAAITVVNDVPGGRICAVRSWTVNGVKDGNSQVGTITSDGAVATYHAPAKVPANRHVRILADIVTPTTVGVRQVQALTTVTLRDPLASVCTPETGVIIGSDACNYVTNEIQVVPGNGGDGEPMYITGVILEISEDDYGEPIGWSMTFWVRYGRVGPARDTTFTGKLVRTGPHHFTMSYDSYTIRDFQLVIDPYAAIMRDVALIGYEGEVDAMPMTFRYHRITKDFIQTQNSGKLFAATHDDVAKAFRDFPQTPQWSPPPTTETPR